MNLLISLFIAILIVGVGHAFIKKYSKLCYILATIISLILVIISYTDAMANIPEFIRFYILPLFTNSAFATSLFIIVMYTGALKNGSKLMKLLFPIRAELSIIASILTLAHNIIWGRYHFVALFTNPKSMALNMLLAAIISLILIAIMLPLMITSFPNVRKKMKYKSWKNLQRFAYAFYGLTYLHILLVMMPMARTGNAKYLINVLVYSIIYLTYAALRINKALSKKYKNKKITFFIYFITIVIFSLGCAYVVYPSIKADNFDSTTRPSYADGTFTGSGSGYNGNITVEVTIEDGNISDIDIFDSVDDEPFITRASSTIFAAVIEAQSVNVDTVSGATYSSKGCINAISDALKSAKL